MNIPCRDELLSPLEAGGRFLCAMFANRFLQKRQVFLLLAIVVWLQVVDNVLEKIGVLGRPWLE